MNEVILDHHWGAPWNSK